MTTVTPTQLTGKSQFRRFWLLIALLFGGYVAVPLWFPLIPADNVFYLKDIRDFAPTLGAGLAYMALMTLLFGGLWLAHKWVVRGALAGRIWPALALTLLFGAPLVFAYPINANDVFRYFIRGRITVFYGDNPIEAAPADYVDDKFLPIAGEWATASSPYGPVWEMTDAFVYRLSGGLLIPGLVLFKALSLLVHTAVGWLIWRGLAGMDAGKRVGRAVLWLWNPALLFMFVVDGHNDSLMLLWLVLGAWLIQTKRPLLGLWVMTLAPLTKFSGLLPIPFFFLSVVRPFAWRERFAFAAKYIAGAVALGWLTFLPFGSPLPLLQRLLDEASGGGGFSPLAFLLFVGRKLGMNPSVRWLTQAGQVWMVAGGLFLLAMVWWKGVSAEKASTNIFLVYLLGALKFRIWYTIWLFPWVLIDRKAEKTIPAMLTFLWTAQLSVIIYGQIKVAWLHGSAPAAHLVAIPFVFGLPLLVWLITLTGKNRTI